ncbi:unnamed protein product [Heterobilharzia americana]|nr:unnamed protein product [Heterobilharzia americana]CAH8482078.1 unnamed protein product [Heterobilharzia americana]
MFTLFYVVVLFSLLYEYETGKPKKSIDQTEKKDRQLKIMFARLQGSGNPEGEFKPDPNGTMLSKL